MTNQLDTSISEQTHLGRNAAKAPPSDHLRLVENKQEPDNHERERRLQQLGIFTAHSLAAMAKSVSRAASLVPGLLRSPSVNFLVGDSGLGKTPLGVQLGLCVASGIPFLGHRIAAPGRVLYCDAESDPQSFSDLIALISGFLGLPEPPANFHVWSPTWDTSQDRAEAHSTWADKLLTRVRITEPTLVIVDPLRMFWSKVEGKNEDAVELIRQLRVESKNYGCTWLLTHHRRKTNPQGQPSNLVSDPNGWFQEAAGSRALMNQSDTRIGVVPHPGEADLLVGGFVRGTGSFVPMDLARVLDDDGVPIGYRALAARG